MLGVDTSTIGAWEKNEHRPTIKMRMILENMINQKELSK
jgi:DNA-binding transcriptional regulator YiaG